MSALSLSLSPLASSRTTSLTSQYLAGTTGSSTTTTACASRRTTHRPARASRACTTRATWCVSFLSCPIFQSARAVPSLVQIAWSLSPSTEELGPPLPRRRASAVLRPSCSRSLLPATGYGLQEVRRHHSAGQLSSLSPPDSPFALSTIDRALLRLSQAEDADLGPLALIYRTTPMRALRARRPSAFPSAVCTSRATRTRFRSRAAPSASTCVPILTLGPSRGSPTHAPLRTNLQILCAKGAHPRTPHLRRN